MQSSSPPAPPSITIEAAELLPLHAELELLRAAYRRRASPVLRWKLANRLSRLADWEALIELLGPLNDLSVDEDLLLARAWLEGRGIDGRSEAMKSIECIFSGASSSAQRSSALVLRARIATLGRDLITARQDLQEALVLDPANRVASIRLARVELRLGRPGEALALADNLAARGITHPYVFAIRALAQAALGQIAESRATIGQGTLPLAVQLAAPPGWNDIAAFNAALAEELLAHPNLRFQRYGASPVETWGIDAPLTEATPLLRQLLCAIATELDRQLETLVAAQSHPWLDARPSHADLHCSCVMTLAEDFEDWHVHPTGWLNGVYYVSIPDAVELGEDHAGCIGLGLPERFVGAEAAAAYGVEVIRPQSGLMLAFPSHTYHRTFAHGGEGRRIAVTFELRPGSS